MVGQSIYDGLPHKFNRQLYRIFAIRTNRRHTLSSHSRQRRLISETLSAAQSAGEAQDPTLAASQVWYARGASDTGSRPPTPGWQTCTYEPYAIEML